MENFASKISSLFDFQKFANNKKLNKVIEESESEEFKNELSMDQLNLVNAAGDVNEINRKKLESYFLFPQDELSEKNKD